MDSNTISKQLQSLTEGIPLELPPPQTRDPNVPHGPSRNPQLSPEEERLAIQNALRYFPNEWHQELGKEFLHELREYGHIYMYRFRPTNYEMKAYPVDAYPAKTKQAASIMMMIMNNLSYDVAQ